MPKSTWHAECPYPRGKEFEACCVGRQGPDVRICEGWLGGGVAVVAMNSKRLKASAVPGKPIGMIHEEKAATAVESFLKWTSSFPSRLNAAVVSFLLFRHRVPYAHQALALMPWLGHLKVEPHLGFFHHVRYNPPFPTSNVFQESWYVSLQKMCCLSPQKRDGATLKAFLTASMCVHRGMLSCPYLTISSKWLSDFLRK